MSDDDRIARLEDEMKRLKAKQEDNDDDEAVKYRSDQYRYSRIDGQLGSQEIHGNLKGLNADDHPHYLNSTRHDVSSRHGDDVVGNRTVDDTSAPTGNEGKLTSLFSWLGYMIKAITGKSNWRTAPATTLEAAKGHIDSTDNPHSVTAAQVGALAKQSGGSLPAATEGNRGQFFTVEGSTGAADQVYVCVKDDSDTYVWQEVSLI